MRALTAAELLSVWERAWAKPPLQQALMLVAAAHPNVDTNSLAQLSIGRRDTVLLSLRESMFGPQIVSVVNCAECEEPLEFDFKIDDIREDSTSEDSHLTFQQDDYEVTFRLPNSLDLVAASHESELIKRCVTGAKHQDQNVGIEDLPSYIVDETASRILDADPNAQIEIALTCAACGHDWSSVFDIVSYLWTEINAWAQRTITEVHTIASAYGWRESEILELTPTRRQIYLNMISP